MLSCAVNHAVPCRPPSSSPCCAASHNTTPPQVYKPATSKPANSEIYVVGHGFRGVDPAVMDALMARCGEDAFGTRCGGQSV